MSGSLRPPAPPPIMTQEAGGLGVAPRGDRAGAGRSGSPPMNHPLTPAEAAILSNMPPAAAAPHTSLPDLAMNAGLSPSEVREALDGLQRRGLVETAHPGAGEAEVREAMVGLTPDGATTARALRRGERRMIVAPAEADLDESQIDARLSQVLERLR